VNGPELAIVAMLQADSQVEDALRGRWSPGTERQGIRDDHLCYHDIGSEEGYFLRMPDGVPKGRFQLDIWSLDPDRRASIGNAVRAALNGKRGWFGPVFVKSCRAALGGDDEETDDESGTDDYWYRRRVDVKIDYEEQPRPIAA
jgi:hypothetical protein